MAKPIKCGERTFPSQKACEQYFKEMRDDGGKLSAHIRLLTDTERMQLIDLVNQRHSDAARKLNKVVVKIEVGPAARCAGRNLSRCFYLCYEDGTRDDIGIASMFKLSPSNHASAFCDHVRKALRSAVTYQIEAVRKKALEDASTKCAECGGLVGEDGKWEIDHCVEDLPIAFETIRYVFWDMIFGAGIIDIDEKKTPVKLIDDSEQGWQLADPIFKEKWQAFHQENAVLRALHKACHRSKSATEMKEIYGIKPTQSKTRKRKRQ